MQDVVDLSWEVFRIRNFKATLTDAINGPIYKKMFDLLPEEQLRTIKALSLRAVNDPQARAEFHELSRSSLENFNNRAITIDSLMASELVKNIEQVERIDRLITSAEMRRNNALHELERHRAGLGAALRLATAEIEEVEFTNANTGETMLVSAK